MQNTGKTILLSSQYFMYFGIMGILLPWFNLYCHHLGFSSLQIGIVSSTRTIIMVVFAILWGLLADKLSSRKPIYLICNFTAILFWAMYMFYTDFIAVLIITILCSIFYGPLISFLEAFTLDLLSDTRSYGRIRLWGSVSFILVVSLSGLAAEKLPLNFMFILICTGSLFMAICATLFPDTDKKKVYLRKKSPAFLKKPVVWIFLFCTFLMLMSHGTYYGFFSIYMEQAGFSNRFTGLAWATGSFSEIFVMLYSRQILKKFTHRDILIFSMGAAVLRWLILYLTVSPAIILVSQCLHAFTYGAFHIASLLCFDEIAGEENRTLSQAVVNSVSYGLGMMAGFIFSGYYYGDYGKTLFLASAVIALTGALLLSAVFIKKHGLINNYKKNC